MLGAYLAKRAGGKKGREVCLKFPILKKEQQKVEGIIVVYLGHWTLDQTHLVLKCWTANIIRY